MSRRQRIGVSLLTLGAIIMVVASIGWLRYDQSIRLQASIADESAAAAAARNPAPKPVQFIAAGKIDIALEPQVVDGNRTTVSRNVGSYLATGIRPGQGGNVILYGHNKREIFGRLSELRTGDAVQVRSEDGRLWNYVVTQRVVVDQADTSLLQPQTGEMLTLYTCSGLFDSKRLVVRASYRP